jgi:hypothetical protein
VIYLSPYYLIKIIWWHEMTVHTRVVNAFSNPRWHWHSFWYNSSLKRCIVIDRKSYEEISVSQLIELIVDVILLLSSRTLHCFQSLCLIPFWFKGLEAYLGRLWLIHEFQDRYLPWANNIWGYSLNSRMAFFGKNFSIVQMIQDTKLGKLCVLECTL